MENTAKFVYVVDWGKHYKDITRYNAETGQRENIFPFKTKLPPYCGIEHHWKYVYEPNYTKKGTINKREPRKLVEKIPVYKNYKWEILETFKHPCAGEWLYPDDVNREEYGKYTEENLLLLASTHTDKQWMKCYIVIEESGVSRLTPEQFADAKFNALIESNLGKWDRETIDKKDVPEEIKSVFYDEDDRVLFGSCFTKGLVSYYYIDKKFSKDGKHIFLYACIDYDGKGTAGVEKKELIKPYKYIKEYIEMT